MHPKSNGAFSIVFVHLGEIPKYLRKNLEYIAKQFVIQSRFIVTDNEELRTFSNLGYQIVKLQDLEIDWPPDFQISGRERLFRNNFWFSTKARLFIIPQFMAVFKVEKVLHIESDVWIHPDFPLRELETLNAALAFPRVDEGRGIASVLLVNGTEGRKLLLEACYNWPHLTDMQILDRLLRKNKNVYELPSTNNMLDNILGNWIFDGAKLGMYLFGADPRSVYGVIRRFNLSPMGSLTSGQEIMVEGQVIYLKTHESHRRVANLHLHSKDVRMYADNWRSVLKRQIRKRKLKLNYGFDFSAFLFFCRERMIHLLRKIQRLS